jgi:hypothetical protein
MHVLTFTLAATLLAIGALGLLNTTSAAEIQTQAIPGLFFGGSILIAALYAFREKRHGMAAASFLTFLAFLTSSPVALGPLYRGIFDWLTIEHRQSTIVMILSALYLGTAFATWKRSRRVIAIARLREGLTSDEPDEGAP